MEKLKRSVIYPWIGVLLGLGSPLGCVGLRWLIAETNLSPLAWSVADIRAFSFFYIYQTIGTVAVFMLVGFCVEIGVRNWVE